MKHLKFRSIYLLFLYTYTYTYRSEYKIASFALCFIRPLVEKGAAGVLFISTPVRGKTRARGLEPLKGDFEKVNDYKGF